MWIKTKALRQRAKPIEPAIQKIAIFLLGLQEKSYVLENRKMTHSSNTITIQQRKVTAKQKNKITPSPPFFKYPLILNGTIEIISPLE